MAKNPVSTRMTTGRQTGDRRLLRRLPLLGAAVAGAVSAYLCDPQRGRARRHRLVDQGAARARRQARRVYRSSRYATSRIHGLTARLQGAGRPQPQDDVDVKQQVHQALARTRIPLADVTIEVSDRVAVLRGQLPRREDIEGAQRAAADAAGVEQVRSYLHLPGESAPNKRDALQSAHH